jgi:hypothetical protein
MMRKTLKFLHTGAACGLTGALLAYAVLLMYAPQNTPGQYADVRHTIDVLCNVVLLPSLAIALISGLLSMAVHAPFQDMRWVWVKALLGLSMFESTLAIIQSKAHTAAKIAAKIAAGEAPPGALDAALSTEWSSLAAILALSVANIALGVWRPALQRRQRVGGAVADSGTESA